jgi:membrane protease YdiL (CAAX protease family)
MNNQSFIKRHGLAIYFILTFGISWIGSFVSVGPKFLAGEAIEFSDGGPMALAMLSAPFIAGILMTYLADGKTGLNELFAKMRKYKVAGRWYLPILIFPIFLFLVAVVLGILVDPEMMPVFTIIGVFAGPLAGILEETGWTGFAYPKMSKKTSALGNAIYLGIIHGIWHIVVWYLSQSGDLGVYWWPYFFGFCLHVVALRVLIVWIYNNTDSVFLAMLMHASSTGFFAILISTTMSPVNWAIYYNIYGIVLCLVALAVAFKFGKTLKSVQIKFEKN